MFGREILILIGIVLVIFAVHEVQEAGGISNLLVEIGQEAKNIYRAIERD